ncbi:MAG: hypothetical protein WBV77_10255, partial [Solirubrobacteraceae bacterium]
MSSRPGAGGRVQSSNLQAAATAQVLRPSPSPGDPGSAVGQLPDGELTARRDAPLGGQAVLEG